MKCPEAVAVSRNAAGWLRGLACSSFYRYVVPFVAFPKLLCLRQQKLQHTEALQESRGLTCRIPDRYLFSLVAFLIVLWLR